MQEGMDTLMAEVESLRFALIIEVFEFLNKFNQYDMSSAQLDSSDFMLMHDLNGSNKFAEVFPVFVREDTMEDSRTHGKNVHEIFPGFVTTGDFLSRVAWGTIK